MIHETGFDIFTPFRRLNESLSLWSRIFVFSFLVLIGLFNECYAQTFAYVSNTAEDTVSVISVSDNTVTATVDVGGGPWGIAAGANADYVYVTNNTDNTVSVINTTNFEVTDTINVGAGPQGIATTFNGGEYLNAFVYVANNGEDTVSVINNVDNSILTNINVGSSPIALGNFIGGLPPEPPSDFDADADSDSKISLSWSYNFTDAAGFILERKLGSSGTFSKVADLTSDATSYRDTNLEEYRTYYYRIAAYNAAGLSDYAEASTTTDRSKGCFIATAAYGSRMAEEVKILKNFRDNVFLNNAPGRSFVKLYFKTSPPLGVSWLALKLGHPATVKFLILLLGAMNFSAVVFWKKIGMLRGLVKNNTK